MLSKKLFEKKGSYNLSQISNQDILMMIDWNTKKKMKSWINIFD